MRTQTGFTIDTPFGLRHLRGADTVVVPGWIDPDVPPSPALVRALRAAHARGARIVSLCTGAFVLADAGLLDGRRATTHWLYADRLRARCTAEIDPDVLYVEDRGVFTSAGTAAGIDLCLHLVALDHGVHVANRVARRIVMPPYRAGGQVQYAEEPAEQATALSPLLDWARDRVGDGISIDDLARHAAMSRRTLTRRFRSTLGVPPGEWLQQERLRLAQQLLETRDDPLPVVARAAGYDSETTMRAQFASRLGRRPGPTARPSARSRRPPA